MSVQIEISTGRQAGPFCTMSWSGSCAFGHDRGLVETSRSDRRSASRRMGVSSVLTFEPHLISHLTILVLPLPPATFVKPPPSPCSLLSFTVQHLSARACALALVNYTGTTPCVSPLSNNTSTALLSAQFFTKAAANSLREQADNPKQITTQASWVPRSQK